MARMAGQSQLFSERELPGLRTRFAEMKLSPADLDAVLDYVRTRAPMIIHIHPTHVLGLLVQDTHYRSQFETNTSSGSLSRAGRSRWEELLFGHLYGKRGTDFDRPKYGCFNLFNDPRGDRRCDAYGDSHLLLKPQVRSRITWTAQDSGCVADSEDPDLHIGTPEHCVHILRCLKTLDLQYLVEVARDGIAGNTSTRPLIGSYNELQIHGELVLARDVQALVMNHFHRRDSKLRSLAEQFAQRNRCELRWMEP